MNWPQRALLIVAGLFCLLFAFSNVIENYDPRPTLATFQFLIAVGLFYWAARRS